MGFYSESISLEVTSRRRSRNQDQNFAEANINGPAALERISDAVRHAETKWPNGSVESRQLGPATTRYNNIVQRTRRRNAISAGIFVDDFLYESAQRP